MEDDIFAKMYFSDRRTLTFAEAMEDVLRREREGEPQKGLYSTTRGRVYVARKDGRLFVKSYRTKL